MALIIEDGTGRVDADSFVDVAAADAFWSARGAADWAGASSGEKEAALRIAADYLGFGYGWPGQPVSTNQALAWPRAGARYLRAEYIAANVVPIEVERAQILLAREALGTDLLKQTAADTAVIKESVSVGPITETKEYLASARRALELPSFAPVDSVLADLATARRGRGGFRSVPLTRR